MRTSLLVVACTLVACSSSSSAPVEGSSAGASTSDSPASKSLSEQLFTDGDPAQDDPVDYVLAGKLGGSTEACLVVIHRRGLHPAKHNWSTVRIQPLGKSQETLEEHGPLEIGWAMSPEASSASDSFRSSGDEIVYARSGGDGENLSLTAHFAAGKPHRFDDLVDASLQGTTSVVGQIDVACENLTALVTLDRNVVKTRADKEFGKWMHDNKDDTAMDFEGCSVASVKQVVCDYGNDTNEEILTLTFALDNGALGDLLSADRGSAR